MAITSRLGLHKPETSGEIFGDYFPDAYAADLQQIDDVVQIKDVAAAGNIPVYGVDGLLADSGIAPADLEAGLISSILTDQGMLLYKAADALAALSPDVAGKSLLTQGAGANPVFGYPNHSTLTNLGIGDPHTQYVLRSLLSARGDLVYRDAAGWQRLPKGVSGTVLMQGANDPYWSMPKLDDLTVPDDNTDLNASTSKHGLMQKYPNTAQALKGDGSWITRYFEIDFPFGNGSDVIEDAVHEFAVPIACKITRADVWEVGGRSSSITCTLYNRALGAGRGSPVDSFVMSSRVYMTETGLNISVSQHNVLRIEVSSITAAKQIVCRLFLEAT
jgi:hypothetical protein